jgi:LmbE family N-acetylglucosaminyl deacetylase
MKLLIIAPHPDDELIGCGGRLAQAAKRNENIRIIYVTSGGSHEFSKREAAVKQISAHIGIKTKNLIFLRNEERRWTPEKVTKLSFDIKKIISNFSPDEIYVSAYEGGNIDHDVANFAVANAIKKLKCKVYEYPIHNYRFNAKKLVQQFLFEITTRLPSKYFYGPAPIFANLKQKPFVLPMTAEEITLKTKLMQMYRELVGERHYIRLNKYAPDIFRRLPKYDYLNKPHRGILGYELAFKIPFKTFRKLVESAK